MYLIWNESAACWRSNHASKSFASFAMMCNENAFPFNLVNYKFLSVMTSQTRSDIAEMPVQVVFLTVLPVSGNCCTAEFGKSKSRLRDFQETLFQQ